MKKFTDSQKLIRQANGLIKDGMKGFEEDPFDYEAQEITRDQLRELMPKHRKHTVTDSLVERLNSIIEDPNEKRIFRENFLNYMDVLVEPKITITSYIHAVKYVSYKLMGYTNFESWIKTFPARYQSFVESKKPESYLHAVVSQYNRGKTVNQILEQAMVPVWVLNQDVFQKAINVQTELMVNARSEKVRSDAANSLMTHLKQPESGKMTLDVTVKEDSSVQELRDATLKLVEAQREMIQSGKQTAKEVAESQLLEGESERIN